MFRTWYVAYKGWLKARKQAERNLSFLEGRKQAEMRVMECQSEIFKLKGKIISLEKENQKLEKRDERRCIQLQDSKDQVLSMLSLVDSVTFETKEEAEASKHRPLHLRLEYFEELIENGDIKRVPKSTTISTNTDPVTIVTGKKRKKKKRPESARRSGSRVNSAIRNNTSRRRVPRCVQNIGGRSIVMSQKIGGHLTWD